MADQDPFAQYAVVDDDPFAPFAEGPPRDPAIPDPASFLPPEPILPQHAIRGDTPVMRGSLLEAATYAIPTGGAMIKGARLLTKLPVARKLGAAGLALATSGPRMRAAKKAWNAAGQMAPKVTGEAAEQTATKAVAAGAKPKLSAQQAKQMLREQFGSEKGGKMLYGRARPGLTATERQTLMRSGTTGGGLPQSARKAIEQELAASTPSEAFAYAAKAPNAPAQEAIGEMLRKALIDRMGR
jgi:hypothetical protein